MYVPGGNANDFVGTIKPHAEKLAHPNFTIHTAKGTMNKEQWLTFLESFANGGGMTEPLSFKVDEDTATQSIIYKVKLTFPDGSVVTADESRGTFKDGMLYHVEPHDPEKYNKLLEMSILKHAPPESLAAGQ